MMYIHVMSPVPDRRFCYDALDVYRIRLIRSIASLDYRLAIVLSHVVWLSERSALAPGTPVYLLPAS